MEKKKKKTNLTQTLTLTLTLPDDVIEEILLRLPVKSLVRFKCVCKSWFSLISKPQFAKSHFDLAVAPTHRLLTDYKRNRSLVGSIEIDAGDSALLHLAVPYPPSCSVYRNKFEILGSCRGFILLGYHKNDNLMLWNPSTGAQKPILRSHNYYSERALYGFGYDASTDDYSIIMIFSGDRASWETYTIVFFSLKTNSWTRIGNIDFPYWVTPKRYRSGVLLNGALHWLIFSKGQPISPVIIAFDLKERSLSEIPVPCKVFIPVFYDNCHLAVIGGCLSLCCWPIYSDSDSDSDSDAKIKIWMMEEYKVQSSWTESINLTTPHIASKYIMPISFTKDLVIVGSNAEGKLIKLNDKGELLELSKHTVRIFKESSQYFTYRESLLSLPREIGENEGR
ncbi:F-box/kelch-repeat protein At3g23880-like [Gastrolobium bilobum]|uniref:F-box/kelch-repeat protein At3g23880-like n=1 Tax=Gastrolobium bilobum TaxID=150636 RepID=UPI002AB19D88|nr:F-box/kelch-repeat protein At3g23880-like [Gastrolobium bilobum]